MRRTNQLRLSPNRGRLPERTLDWLPPSFPDTLLFPSILPPGVTLLTREVSPEPFCFPLCFPRNQNRAGNSDSAAFPESPFRSAWCARSTVSTSLPRPEVAA